MSENHSPEPWVWDCCLVDANGDDVVIESYYDQDNMDRVMACVNAMAGIPNPQAFVDTFVKQQEALDVVTSTLDLWHRIGTGTLAQFAKDMQNVMKPNPPEIPDSSKEEVEDE